MGNLHKYGLGIVYNNGIVRRTTAGGLLSMHYHHPQRYLYKQNSNCVIYNRSHTRIPRIVCAAGQWQSPRMAIHILDTNEENRRTLSSSSFRQQYKRVRTRTLSWPVPKKLPTACRMPVTQHTREQARDASQSLVPAR